MDMIPGMQKMSVGQPPAGRGAACLTCKGICSGFQPHSWRKACTQCHCSQEDHAPSSDLEDDYKMGRLLENSNYAHLTAKVKGGDGLRVYKRNRMIITNPVVSRKDPTFNTITYDWAPPGLTQKLAMQYMELLPEERRPVAGMEGALYRRRQLMKQLPAYDQDPSQCHSLSEAEVKTMAQFVKSYKEDALGVGEVALPGEGGMSKDKDGKQKNGKEQPNPEPTTNGTLEENGKKSEYRQHPKTFQNIYSLSHNPNNLDLTCAIYCGALGIKIHCMDRRIGTKLSITSRLVFFKHPIPDLVTVLLL